MAARKRNRSQRERDLLILEEMYCQRRPQHEMAGRLALSEGQISKDLKIVHARILERRRGERETWLSEQLARIDALERAAWEAYLRSCTKRKRTVAKKVKLAEAKERNETTAQEDTRDGDPRFLERVSWCIAERSKLLGLYAPLKYKRLEEMSIDELRALAGDGAGGAEAAGPAGTGAPAGGSAGAPPAGDAAP